MNNLPEKLREVSDSYYDTITTGSSNTWDAPILMYAAADEIERLRKAIVDYVMTISDCYATPATDSDALELLKQAVRGD